MTAAGSARSFFDGLARKASYTVGLVGGLFTMVVGPSPKSWRRSRRQVMSSRPGTLIDRAGGFAALRKTLLGSSKGEVVAVLGSPLAAAVRESSSNYASAAVLPNDSAFWVTDVWYYPFDPGRKAAVAVKFNRGRVASVEFIGGF
jgi:hypothetical protein